MKRDYTQPSSPAHKPRIFFLAGNQPGNLGDIMLNRGILRVLQDCGEVFIDKGAFTEEEWSMFDLTDSTVRHLLESEQAYGARAGRPLNADA